MGKFKDLTGMKFGKLTVIERAEDHIEPNGAKRVQWLCRCDCGNKVIVLGNNLNRGYTTSCGCRSASGGYYSKHKLTRHPLYDIWSQIKQRCYNLKNKGYKYYGGRGITICDEWLNDFMSFYNWAISNGYKEGLTLDRIDVNGNYESSNCRWVTMKVQGNNRRNNHLITFNGETHTMAEWAGIIELSKDTLSNRINILKWDITKALTTPAKKHNKNT